MLSGLKWDMLQEVFNSLKNYRLLSDTCNLLMWVASKCANTPPGWGNEVNGKHCPHYTLCEFFTTPLVLYYTSLSILFDKASLLDRYHLIRRIKMGQRMNEKRSFLPFFLPLWYFSVSFLFMEILPLYCWSDIIKFYFRTS